MIKIGVDGGDYQPHGRVTNGIQRVASSFLSETLKIKDKNLFFDYYYFGGEKNPANKRNFSFFKLPQRFFSSIFLPLSLIKNNDNIFLGFSGSIPYWLKYFPIKKILFIYDLGFIKYPSLYPNHNRLIRQTISSINRADKIIVLSDYIRADLLKMFPQLSQKKIIKIYAGVDHIKKVKPAKIKIELGSYLLYVGLIKSSKNIAGLIKYFAKLPNQALKLVLIGKKEGNHFQEVLALPEYQLNKKRVHFLEHVSDEELVAYYQGAQEILNFSFEEGFCYPILEAMALGKKTTTNDLPLYQEFKKYFKIGEIPENFTWKHFTKELLAIFR